MLTSTTPLEEARQTCWAQLCPIFHRYIQNIPEPTLQMAVQNALLHPGKLIRPLLVYAVGALLGVEGAVLAIPASAVECIHTYSLIHDDLPAMDNADIRRGRPTCHRQYGESMAILTGDALQTLAFHILSEFPGALTASQRCHMVMVLAQASGPRGMIGGQAYDMSLSRAEAVAEERQHAIAALEHMYTLKTGALLTACVELGWITANNHNDALQARLRDCSHAVGLAFQLQDDVADMAAATLSAEEPNKTRGLDQKNDKLTYPSIEGIQEAKQKIFTLRARALEAIALFGEEAGLLRTLIYYILPLV